jgi:hypothetical protein
LNSDKKDKYKEKASTFEKPDYDSGPSGKNICGDINVSITMTEA